MRKEVLKEKELPGSNKRGTGSGLCLRPNPFLV